jgi:hypothetical protein
MTPAPTISSSECGLVKGDSRYGMHVAGTSRRQEILEHAVGQRTEDGAHYRCPVLIVPEPSNPYDPTAVSVMLGDAIIGYLERNVAPPFRQALAEGGFAGALCGAMIVGGWERDGGDRGHFGVRLDARLPFQIEKVPDDGVEEIVASLGGPTRVIPKKAPSRLADLPANKRSRSRLVLKLLIALGVMSAACVFMLTFWQPPGPAVPEPETIGSIILTASRSAEVPLPRPRPMMTLTSPVNLLPQ